MLNDLDNNKTEDFLYLQWHLALTNHVQMRHFVIKQDTPKQNKTTYKQINLTSVSQTKELKLSIFLINLKMFFPKIL